MILKLAWRNIWRNKRRSILTLLAVTFATFAAISMRGVQIGTYAVNIKNAVELFSGYMQIQHPQYLETPSVSKNFTIDKDMREFLETNELIQGYAERINAEGLISFKDNSMGAMIFGINPAQEKRTTNILTKLNAGKFFESDTSLNIVIGNKLLKNLKAEIGDHVVVLAQGFDGSLGNLKFKITGTVKMGFGAFDGMAVFMGTETARELLGMYGRVHSIAIALESLDDIEQVKADYNSKVKNDRATILSWEEVMPDLKQGIELDNVSGIFFLLILILIVAFYIAAFSLRIPGV